MPEPGAARRRAPALLLLHRLRCDPCYDALASSAADPGTPCAEGAALAAAAQATLARPAAQPATAGTAAACQAPVDTAGAGR
jgi:hypothetical protein